MKVSVVIFFVLYINQVCGYVYKQVEGIYNTTILRLEFDSSGNTYAAGTNREHQNVAYKLSPQNEILAEVDLPNGVYRMVVNKENDVYFYLYSDISLSLDVVVWRRNSSKLEILDNTLSTILFLLDETDNLYYCKENGINLLRSNSTSATPIQNLENFYNKYNSYAIDHEGNIFLEVNGLHERNTSVALITKEGAQQDPPQAEIIIVNEDGQFTEGLAVDQNDDIWIFTTSTIRTAYIKKFSKGNLQTILFDEKYDFHYGVAIEDKILVVATTNNEFLASIYFISLDGTTFIEIPALTDFEYNVFHVTTVVTDSEANIYLASSFEFTPELGPLVFIKRNETSVTPIRFNTNITDPIEISEYLLTDQNDDLWILTHNDGVYHVKKGEVTAEKIPSTAEFEFGLNSIAQNPVTKQIFVARYDELFVIEAE